ncbi:hypothetical protein GQ55_9G193700 [Panicum hallii var. hallii]|uniref:Uncharacterized protein n=1 Tax=Panicum hallii var. hallii TaxID=1504633 RepID=A0A2T7C4Z0_9POAL|nr:hypothetical protein GQ55_9G193700 [Panicum hallii var. hallii]
MVVCHRDGGLPERAHGSKAGLEAQRPVILPPLEAGGNRCSVKPASRVARRSRCWDAKAFAEAPNSPLRNLERAGRRMRHQTQAQAPQLASAPP